MLSDEAQDEGFSMVEVVVAFVLFTVLATTAGVALTAVLRTSRTNEARVVAANLAAREIETVRGLSPDGVVDGAAPTQTVVLDGRTYYVDRTSTLDSVGGSGSACSGASGPAAYLRVRVTVRWKNMQGTPAVRSDTLKALTVSGLSGGTGVLSVPVVDAAGNGVEGVPVALGTRTATTGDDGCAVFAGVGASTSLTASVAVAGSVGRTGVTSQSQTPLAVYPNQVTKAAGFVLDRAAAVTLTVPAPGGYPVPTTLAVSLANTDYPTGARALTRCAAPGPDCVTGSGGTLSVAGLFPSPAGYGVWPGACTSSRPASPALATTAPGGTSTVTTTSLGGASAVVKKGNAFKAGHTVTATNPTCPTEVHVFPGTSGPDAASALRLALPPGTWSLTASDGGAPGPATSVTVTAGQVPAAPAVVVAP